MTPGSAASGSGPLRRRESQRLMRLGTSLRSRPVEWLFVVALVAGLVKAAVEFPWLGYLPLPFWPDPNDVYADGYSTAWWAFNGGEYETWKTVYPPLSFIVTKLLATGRCYNADVGFARDCDWGLWTSLLAIYVLNAGLAFLTYRKSDRLSAIPRTMALMFGLPMLYAFEHLNLLVLAYTGLFIAFGIGIKSARLRWLGFAIAINLKIYLIVVLLGQLLKRRWRWVEGALIMAAGVYALSYAVRGDGSPLQVVRNIMIFSQDPNRAASWYFVFYASSYTSMVGFLGSEFRLMPILGSWRLEFWADALTLLVLAVQALTLMTFVAIWLKPAPISRTRIAALCYLLVLISNETGGYTAAGAVFLVFFERWKGAGRIAALASAYLLCLALDLKVAPIGTHIVNGYFAGRPVWQDMWVTAGPFLRPGLMIVMQLGLIAASWNDLRRSRPAPSAQDSGPSMSASPALQQ